MEVLVEVTGAGRRGAEEEVLTEQRPRQGATYRCEKTRWESRQVSFLICPMYDV